MFFLTNICPRSEASGADILVLRTSNFQGATIGPGHKHSIVFIVPTKFSPARQFKNHIEFSTFLDESPESQPNVKFEKDNKKKPFLIQF